MYTHKKNRKRDLVQNLHSFGEDAGIIAYNFRATANIDSVSSNFLFPALAFIFCTLLSLLLWPQLSISSTNMWSINHAAKQKKKLVHFDVIAFDKEQYARKVPDYSQ